MKKKDHQNMSKSDMSIKTESSILASLDTAQKKKNFAPLNAEKRKVNWDEEDEFVDQSGIFKVEQQLIDLKASGVEVYAVEKQVKVQDYPIITTNNSKASLLIIDQLGRDWKDLLCYNYELRTILHLKREDLMPSEVVDAAITFLQNLKR